MLCGVFAALAFHLYNGYWYLVPTIAVAWVWWWRRERPRRLAFSALGANLGAGLLLPIGWGSSVWRLAIFRQHGGIQRLGHPRSV